MISSPSIRVVAGLAGLAAFSAFSAFSKGTAVAAPGAARSASSSVPAACSDMQGEAGASLRSLADVMARLQDSSRREALDRDLAAVEALEAQAAARPNPELVIDLQDFSGSGEYSAFGQSQNTLSFSQRLEVGGRRAARVEAAERETGVERARTSREALRLSVAAKQGFVEVLARRARLDVQREGERLARQLAADAGRRAAGGAASSADLERANVAATTASLDVSAARRELAAAAQRLAALWGGSADDLDCLAGELATPGSPRGDAAPGSLATSPAVVLAEAEVEARRAEVARVRAEALRDLEVGAGLRHLAGPDELSVVAGLSVEVPLFDRGAGAIASAEQRLFAAQARARVAGEEAAGRQARLRQAVDAAAERATVLASRAVPAARRAYDALVKAWREGAASSMEVLEARRALVALRLEQLEAAAEYHRSFIALEGALGAVSPGLAVTSTAAHESAGGEEH